ncbi:MAG: ABC transporter ATP-binding protein [Chloroflexi bacterium]|nr:ABC transporter ATP-binding protein [Chloroflexota bacterium]
MGESMTATLAWETGTSDETPLSVRDLWVEYATRRGFVQAVRGVQFDVRPGESLSFIGESGSGKTTLGLALIRLLATTATIRKGQITYRRNGQVYDILSLSEEEMRQFRWRECAMVFQSALNAFNPVLRIWDQINDTARAHGETDRQKVQQRALDLMRFVQLDPERVIMSYPHELSGGMRQRVLLALALLLNPQILILDEPTTALDILTQRSIIDLLRRLKEELHFSMIFISHDLSLAAELADRVATMYAGAIVELGEVHDIFYRPHHPYTLGLIRAVPTVTGDFEELVSIPGSPPDLINLPSGCKFHPRCPFVTERCRKEEPGLIQVEDDHYAACFHWEAVAEELERNPVRRSTTNVGD